MSYAADTLDLSTLESTPLVEIDREAIIAARKVLFAAIWAEARAANPSLPDFDTLNLEYEPVTIQSQAWGNAEALILAAINDSGKKLRLKDAWDTYLDHLATTYHRTTRKIIRAATDTTDAVYESDTAYRARAQLAPEALADMGITPGGYVYKVRTAFADRIKHVYPINRGEGRVELRLLGRDGNGAVEPATIADVVAAFRIEEGQQSTDVLTVLSADIEEVIWDVTLYIKRGPDPAAIKALALAQLQALADQLHKLNETHYRSAITTAASPAPVVTAVVNSPAADLMKAVEKAYYVSAINVAVEVLP